MPKISAEKLDTELTKGTLAPIYLLTGEDVYRKNLVIKKLKELVNPDDFNYFRGEATSADISEAIAQANTAPVFSQARFIVLTGLDKLRKDAKNIRTVLTDYLNSPLPTTTLVLTHNDAKKMKTEKILAELCADHGRVVNFDELKGDDLTAWVRAQLAAKGLQGDFDSIHLLCEGVGSELAALENEIEKLYLYTLDREDKKITSKDVLTCIGFSKEQNPFELSNLITACRKQEALALIDKLIEDGEEPVAVLAKMTYPIIKMARIRRLSDAGLAPNDILRNAGLMPWESRLISNVRRFPTQNAFLNTLNRLIDADAAFKTSTASNPKNTLKGILLTLFR